MKGNMWQGRPNGVRLINPVGIVIRLLPALIGCGAVVWLMLKVYSWQTVHCSFESLVVDGLVLVVTMPLLAPCVFIALEPLRRKLFWRRLTYELDGTSARIKCKILGFVNSHEKKLEDVSLISIYSFSGYYTIDFGELKRWFSYLGKNGGVREEFEFSCLRVDDVQSIMTICLERGIPIEAYKSIFQDPVQIRSVDEFMQYMRG